LSTVWRNSCSVAASGAGSNWNRCTSRLSSDVKRLVSADKLEGTVLMSGNNTSVPHIVAWSWPYWTGERSDASNASGVCPRSPCRNRRHWTANRTANLDDKPKVPRPGAAALHDEIVTIKDSLHLKI
jgi:hypothetical protein